MQYRAGDREKETANKSCPNNDSLMFSSMNKATTPIASIHDTDSNQKNINPAFCIFLPLEVINSKFSLSKDRGALLFTSRIADIKAIQNIIPPNGCGISNPAEIPVKKTAKNIKFQKLSLLSLSLIKLRIAVFRFLLNYKPNSTINWKRLLGFYRYLKNFKIVCANFLYFNVKIGAYTIC